MCVLCHCHPAFRASWRQLPAPDRVVLHVVRAIVDAITAIAARNWRPTGRGAPLRTVTGCLTRTYRRTQRASVPARLRARGRAGTDTTADTGRFHAPCWQEVAWEAHGCWRFDRCCCLAQVTQPKPAWPPAASSSAQRPAAALPASWPPAQGPAAATRWPHPSRREYAWPGLAQGLARRPG